MKERPARAGDRFEVVPRQVQSQGELVRLRHLGRKGEESASLLTAAELVVYEPGAGRDIEVEDEGGLDLNAAVRLFSMALSITAIVLATISIAIR